MSHNLSPIHGRITDNQSTRLPERIRDPKKKVFLDWFSFFVWVRNKLTVDFEARPTLFVIPKVNFYFRLWVDDYGTGFFLGRNCIIRKFILNHCHSGRIKSSQISFELGINRTMGNTGWERMSYCIQTFPNFSILEIDCFVMVGKVSLMVGTRGTTMENGLEFVVLLTVLWLSVSGSGKALWLGSVFKKQPCPLQAKFFVAGTDPDSARICFKSCLFSWPASKNSSRLRPCLLITIKKIGVLC